MAGSALATRFDDYYYGDRPGASLIISRVIKNEPGMAAAFNESDNECVIHTALYILACTESSLGFVGDICFSPQSREIQSTEKVNRYKWKPHTDWQIYRILVHDSKIYMDVLRALPTLRRALSENQTMMSQNTAVWTWNYCAFISDSYNKEDGSKQREAVAWKKVYTTTDDLYIPCIGNDFVLTRRQQIIDDAKYTRMKARLLGGIAIESAWLNCADAHPYLGAMSSQTLSGERDIFRLYEYVFYVCLENCHSNTPDIGVVFSRDAISQRPLTFEIKSKQRFVEKTLKLFQPIAYANGKQPDLVHDSLDTTCIGPIAIGPVALAVAAKPPGHSLAELLKNCKYFTSNKFRTCTIKSGGALSTGCDTTSVLMHLSMYSPSYIRK